MTGYMHQPFGSGHRVERKTVTFLGRDEEIDWCPVCRMEVYPALHPGFAGALIGYNSAMSKEQEQARNEQSQGQSQGQQDRPEGSSIEAKHGELRWRDADGDMKTGKKLNPGSGQQVWLDADKDGEAEAVVTQANPMPDGSFEHVVTEPGLVWG